MLAGSLRRVVSIRGDREAFRCGDDAVKWATLLDRAARLAGGLSARGIRPGDRIAAMLPNGLAVAELFAACAWAGLVAVPLNFRWTESEVADALADCDPALLVVDQAHGALGRAAAARAGVPVIDATDRYAALLGAPAAAHPSAANDLLAIFYTGGTTGRSKGVMLSHGNIMYNAMACMTEGMFGPDEVQLHASPAFHIAGALGLYAALLSGSRNIILPRFDAGMVLELIGREGVTQSLLVPTMIGMMLDDPAFGTSDLRSLSTVLYGASPMPDTLLTRAMAALPDARFLQLYGMTELSPTATVLHGRERTGSTGRAIIGTEVRIADADGTELPRGEVGEIQVRGPGVMLGYWNNAAATDAAVTDGWMRTGDGGRMDADGFVFLADRLKDMIISGGENIFSVEVENVLMRHPAVRQCAVIGVPDPRWGEAVHAVVVPHEGGGATAEELLAFAAGELAGFKRPRSVEFRHDGLPLSGAGKVLKTVLRQQVQATRTEAN